MVEPPETLQGYSFLVTGGAGFIGSHLAEEILKRGGRVKILDNFSTGLKKNLSSFIKDIEVIEGDIRDPASTKRATMGVDYVFHQAAFVSVPLSVQNPAQCLDVNIKGTLNLLETSRNMGVRRFIFASSSSVYGDKKKNPKSERMRAKPISPYGFSKFCGEYLSSLYYRLYGLETVSLRYFNVFGPRQRADSDYSGVISRFIRGHIKDGFITIYGDGNQTRDFTFVKDVVRANLLLLFTDRVAGKVFNVGTEKRTTIIELADMISEITERSVDRIYKERRAGDIMHSCADISLLKAVTGFRPHVDLRSGLVLTVHSFL